MNHFQQYGRTLLANGYMIVPIRRGEKRPAISGWQKSRLGAGDLARYPDHGVGVLCGQGAHPIVGVDIDVSHPVIGPALIDWCQTNLGMAPERVGAAPRVCLVYRADRAGWAKGASAQFFDATDPVKPNGKPNHQQVEILGHGQQFVAYHEHPDVGRDYEWVDIMGGIEYVNAADLTVITEAQVDMLLAEVLRLVRATPSVEMIGTSDSPVFKSASDADDLLALSTRTGTSFEEIEQRMATFENADADYDTWLHVGQALHHEYAGTAHEDAAVDLWRAWGATSSKDDPKAYGFKWRSFGKTHSGSPTTLRWLLKMTRIAKLEAEAEDKQAKLQQIKQIIAEQETSVDLGTAAARIKDLMPDDAMLRAEILGAYQRAFKKLTGTSLAVTQARTMLLGPRVATVLTKRALTEFGNAERMLDRYADGLMYVPESDDWYLWTGVFWRRASVVEIEHLAKETIRSLPNEREEHEDAAEFFQFCAISQQAKMVKNMIQLARSDARVYIPAHQLDKHSHLLGVQNGVVDLRSGKLLASNPEYRTTLTMACDYVPEATCPTFERTVLQVFSDDQEMADYFLLTLGYTLMGKPKEDIMFIPFGNGANGKSTVLGAVRKAFGSYARSAEASSFVKDGVGGGNAGGPREDLVRLRGSRFVYVNEPDENGELREGAVKSMTGGDAITARGIHAKSSVEVEPSWVVYMPTNHKPIIKGGDNGIWRRLGLLPFDRNFENDPNVRKDPDLADKLAKEMEGVVALLVRKALEYQKGGLAAPGRVKAARDAYRSQMDILAEWLDECCDLGDYEVESSKLWVSWELFAKNRGLGQYVRSSVALGRRLDSRFPASKGNKGVRVRRGLRLKGESVAGEAGDDLF